MSEELLKLTVRLHLALVAPTAPRRRDERGDVPGWVMGTVMTAGLVVLIWGLAKDQLGQMLKDALGSVKG
jgi:hypothetical protein